MLAGVSVQLMCMETRIMMVNCEVVGVLDIALVRTYAILASRTDGLMMMMN